MQKDLPPVNPPWKVFEPILVLLIINIISYLLSTFGGSWLISLAKSLPGGYSKLNQLLVSSLLQTVLFIVFIGYYVFLKYKTGIRSLGLVRNRFFYWVKIGLINGLILFFAVSLIGMLINWLLPFKIKPQPIAEIIITAQTPWEIMIPFIVASLFAPLSEELFFRGFLYPALKSKIGVVWGIIITSLIFGGLHFDLVRLIPLTLGGIWLNWLYEKSGSIYTPIIAHSVWNGTMTVFIFSLSPVV